MGSKFPQFEIAACLGRGGMGVVYKARQKSLDRWVAIKILAPERIGDEKFAGRFAREAQLLAKLNHPNIVAVFDHGETDGLFYIVMEFVDGVNLRDLLRDGKLEAKSALAIVPPVCEALQYAHDKGIVHRDIKPENLLLDREGKIKIADFGIASMVGAGNERAGTPPYMAPEQNDSSSAVDHRADIYALGVVLYEMLTGERPGKDFVAPSKRVQVDIRIDEMVIRALETEPGRRYQTAREFHTAAETMVGEIGRTSATSSAPTVVTTLRGVPPRISRMAMVGACWAPFFFVMAGMYFTDGNFRGPSWWPMPALTLLPPGCTAPLGTTILGWIAISKIRCSAGTLGGLGLAVFDALIFPLFALYYVIAWLCHSVGIAFFGWTQNYHEVQNAQLIVVSTVIAAVPAFFIARGVWRAAQRP